MTGEANVFACKYPARPETTAPCPATGFSLAYLMAAIACLLMLSLAAVSYLLPTLQNNDRLARITHTDRLMRQSAYLLAAAASDSDYDDVAEAPAFLSGTFKPTGGGNVPAVSNAPQKDAWGHLLGYCPWDNGSVMSSSGYNLPGDNPATDNSVVFALIWPGLDRKFQTDCATAKTGQALGDDLVKAYTIARIRQGLPNTPFQGAPVNNASTLAALTTSGLQPGHMRLQTDTGTLSAWNGSSWATVTGVPSNPAAGYKNILVNGNFDIWQRGTGSVNVTNGNGSYIADHWMLNNGSGSSDDCYGYQVSLGGLSTYDAPVGADYAIQIDPPTTYNGLSLMQPIENVRTWAGQTVTLSWWARTVNGGSVSIMPYFLQDFGPGGSTGTQANGTAVPITQYWTRYWQTFTLPALPANATIIAGQDYLGLYFWLQPAADSVQIAQVQLELGAQPTGFEHRPQAVELRMAQRYYENNYFDIGDDTADTLNQWLPSATVVTTPWAFRTPKRILPDGSISSRNVIGMNDGGSAGFAEFTCGGVIYAYTCPVNITKTGFADQRQTNGSAGVKTQVLWWDADAEFYD